MIIVGFTNKTSKILPRIFCQRFRHCAPIIINAQGQMILYQFVRCGHVSQIPITIRGLQRLRANGWKFIILSGAPHHEFNTYIKSATTCVALTRHAIGIHRIRPITPYGLYKQIAPMGDLF